MRRALISSAAALLLLALGAAAAAGKPDAVRWREPAEGEAESKRTGKPVFYFFTADWCGPCHLLVDQVFSDETAAAALEKAYVPVRLEDRRRQEGKNAAGMDALVRTYGIRGFPTLIVARPGAAKGLRLGGWAGRAKTLEFIDQAAPRLREMESEGAAKR